MTPARPSRLFRYARQSIKNLTNNQPHQFAAGRALVHYPSGSIYSYIPKNACTTLRYSLAIANGCLEGPENFEWVHNNNQTFKAELRDMVTAPYTFVILRCPFTRLASAFLDKIIGREADYWPLHRHEQGALDFETLTFRGFIELLQRPGRLRFNPHWRPQIDFLVYEDYDNWFALETLSDAFRLITERTGLEIHDARGLSRHSTQSDAHAPPDTYADMPAPELYELRRAGTLPRHIDLYDEGLIKTVSGLYAEDISLYKDRFGAADLLTSRWQA